MEDSPTLPDHDRRLLELASAVLVDPRIHTDARMRLYGEISELLHATADEHGHRLPGSEERPRVTATRSDQVTGLLESVLTDPNLHTDTRMRLHQELRDMLDAARSGPDVRTSA